MNNITLQDLITAFDWSENPSDEELLKHLKTARNAASLAYAMGLDATVEFWGRITEVINDELDAREMAAGAYHH